MRALRKPDFPTRVVCNEYDLLHDCITVQELRWILHYGVERYSAHWMFYLLRLDTGCRTGEMLQHMTLYNLSSDLWEFTYAIAKPGKKISRSGDIIETHKHRRVRLSPGVRNELVQYLNRHCRIINGQYVSPYPNQQIFPWYDYKNKRGQHVKATQTVGAYWWKLKNRMKKAGFDAHRKIRDWRRDSSNRRAIPVFVLRPHILRHFFLSRFYYRNGKDIIACMKEIQHNDVETCRAYLHTAQSMGTTEQELQTLSLMELLGYDEHQQVINQATGQAQTSLTMY